MAPKYNILSGISLQTERVKSVGEKLQSSSQSSRQDFIREPHEYKAGVLTITLALLSPSLQVISSKCESSYRDTYQKHMLI
jgi:hypothetical protein